VQPRIIVVELLKQIILCCYYRNEKYSLYDLYAVYRIRGEDIRPKNFFNCMISMPFALM